MIEARFVTADDLDEFKAQLLVELRAELLPEWLNERDGAAYLGVPAKSLGNARRDGKVAASRIGGRIVYQRGELDRYALSLRERR